MSKQIVVVMTKHFFCSIFITLLTLNGHSQVSDQIKWPEAYEPSKSRFYVHNEIEIEAKPEKVWSILVDALKWESWYKGAKDIVFVDSAHQQLQSSTVMKWSTMGLRFRSEIKEFQPYRLLAWESIKKSIRGYHVWLIIPTDKGCKVITDESQNGWLTFFEKTFQRKKLNRLHDLWLAELKKRAE